MLGYMGEQAKTDEAVDQYGWLHSGDKGKLDQNGMLYITGRYKEILITAGGENIAPVPIEERIKDALAGVIEYVVMVADKRKFCSVLFVLKTEPGLNSDGQPIATNKLTGDALKVDPDCQTIADAAGDDCKGTGKWRETLQAGIDKYNVNPVSQAAKIQAFRICPDGFSIGNGLLTDTTKLKRSKVYEKHKPLVEVLYAEADMLMAEKAKAKDGAALQEFERAQSNLEKCQSQLEDEYKPMIKELESGH